MAVADQISAGAVPVQPEPTRDQSPIYTVTELGRELRQAEIISDLWQYGYDPVKNLSIEFKHPYAIVMTQDCDLLQDFERTQSGKPRQLNGVLFYEALLAEIVKAESSAWKRITQNKEDRFQFLESVPVALDTAGVGLPEMVIDFKKYFTIPANEVYRQCLLHGPQDAKRRCRLEMPYREHLQGRAAFYMQRVMLPLGHQSSITGTGAKTLPVLPP